MKGSLDSNIAAYAGGRVRGITATRGIDVDVRTLDSFELNPTIVKIDVQGTSMRVLRGMPTTLEASRPLLIIESGREDDDVQRLLEEHGYRRVRWHSTANPRPANWIFVP